MRLKIGELAGKTGMTVRTLHHYDAIGLLKPSGRTESGHRLYTYPDMARLHAIQALRQIGLPLNQIGELLSGEPEPLPVIIRRQIASLESHIAGTVELCNRLKLLDGELAGDGIADTGNWLATLAAMNAYGKHFNATEIARISADWKAMRAQWRPLIAAMRQAIAAGVAPDSPEAQRLARQWMELMFRWMKGDWDLLDRWQVMYLKETAAQGLHGIDLPMVQFIDVAAGLRLEALMRHFTKADLESFPPALDQEWKALARKIDGLIEKNTAPTGKKGRAVADEWNALVDRATGHNPALRQKLLAALEAEPLLRAGSSLSPKQADYIRQALQSAA